MVAATARGRWRPARPPRARGALGGGPGSPRSSATLRFPQRPCPRRPGWDVTPPPASRGAPKEGCASRPQPPGRPRRPGPRRAREARPGRCRLSVRAASREGQRRGSGRLAVPALPTNGLPRLDSCPTGLQAGDVVGARPEDYCGVKWTNQQPPMEAGRQCIYKGLLVLISFYLFSYKKDLLPSTLCLTLN